MLVNDIADVDVTPSSRTLDVLEHIDKRDHHKAF